MTLLQRSSTALGSSSQPQERSTAQRGEGRRHVLDLDDFTQDELAAVFELSNAMQGVLARQIKRVPALRGKAVLLLFYEPSTRTRVSFEMAAKALGADVVGLQAQASSVVKGESLIDTARTLQALGADLIVMRHPSSGAPYQMARYLDIGVINAGDGWHAHPTQALLDLYTIRQHLGRIEGLKVVIVGDILHSRVARSNLWGLTTMGAAVTVCGPPTLLPLDLGHDDGLLPKVQVEEDLNRALEGADVVMVLRLQRERQEAGLLPSLREYAQRYQLNTERLRQAKANALVMHPGPMNQGIEISPEVAYGSQSMVETQVTNGVAVRMALLYMLLGGPKR